MNVKQYENFSFKVDDSGVARAILDVPGKPLNILTHKVMSELEEIVDWVDSHREVKLFVISSSKESGFLAGADIGEIEKIASPQEADELLRYGQNLFDRIERLASRTLAVIHGPCLGGGLELAMACDYRVARDNSSTKIGLPEIKLGLIPGWGGTQRLPKWVGLRRSLEMILSGKTIDAQKAYRIGLVDRAVAPEDWRDEVARMIVRLSTSDEHLRRSRRPTSLRTRFANALLEANAMGRSMVFSATRKRLFSKMESYPALDAAIDAIADGFNRSKCGYETEREEFGWLIGTPTCRNLVRLFFSREAARKLSTWSPDAVRAVHQSPIRSVGVIGAGAMGAGIGFVSATRGYDVILKEVNQETVDAGKRRIGKLTSEYSEHKRLDADKTGEIEQRLVVSDRWDKFADCELVVEAIVEQMDVKQRVLSEAERHVSGSTILATNTSSLSVTEMAESLNHPERFAGLHFFNPVPRMELVEVVRGEKTCETTIARLVSFVRALGKTPIVTADSPGFLVNRILFPYLGEAILMVRDGYSIDAIDAEIRRFGMPMGPLELLDQVGLDVALSVAKSLSSILANVDDVVDVLAPLVMRGDLGKKAGVGFYTYRGKQKRSVVFDEEVPAFREETIVRPDGLSDIQRRVIYPMLAEAVRCHEEAVVPDANMIDLGMILGTGFAPHRGGPMRTIESIGINKFMENMAAYERRHGVRFQPPRMDRSRGSFTAISSQEYLK